MTDVAGGLLYGLGVALARPNAFHDVGANAAPVHERDLSVAFLNRFGGR